MEKPKREVKKNRINTKKLVILGIVAVVILLALIFVAYKYGKKPAAGECIQNEDCVPASCCHANSCIAKEKAQKCTGSICSNDCSGSLDCNQGECACSSGKCIVIKK